jgi:hypothetical protein
MGTLVHRARLDPQERQVLLDARGILGKQVIVVASARQGKRVKLVRKEMTSSIKSMAPVPFQLAWEVPKA